MLTYKQFLLFPPGIFAGGVVMDQENGFNYTGSRQLLRWVATKGYAPDWAIYIGLATQTEQYIKSNGDKVIIPAHIKTLLPVDKALMNAYRY